MSDDLAARLRERGRRLTPQRQLILQAVEALHHATPDEVLAHVRSQVSSVNASTVYRTLEVLEELGLVRHTAWTCSCSRVEWYVGARSLRCVWRTSPSSSSTSSVR